MRRGTKVLDRAISAILDDWEDMEMHLDEAMDAAPYGSDANEWGHIMAVKYLIDAQIHALQQMTTTHDPTICSDCQEEQRDAEDVERAWTMRLLWEVTL